ncbi:MAG: DUF2809 domain-containing protein [Blastocatellia bacterium]|nr:DUF2809 domain-containing protein [Blastocatellia bacterium]
MTVFAGLVVVTGLASRKFGHHLPGFIAAYAGDALWALLVFCLLGLVWNRLATGKIAVAALVISYVVEFSQLFHPGWLEAVRHTLAGRLVLGTTFVWSDLVCYTVGVLVGVGIELIWFRRMEVIPAT